MFSMDESSRKTKTGIVFSKVNSKSSHSFFFLKSKQVYLSKNSLLETLF